LIQLHSKAYSTVSVIGSKYLSKSSTSWVLMFGCIHGQALQYLDDFCQPASVVTSLRRLIH